MKTVTILFGEMGCGKTYCGSRYAEKHGLKFFDGDTVVTARMMNKILHFKPITPAMLQEYMEILAQAIADRMVDCDHLMVAQALYLDENRKFLQTFLQSLGFEVKFWWVKVSFWRNIKNLLTRERGWKWVFYWLFNKSFFQKPSHYYEKFTNI